eukprot:356660-Chlamydomonas_euryale.AAC.5
MANTDSCADPRGGVRSFMCGALQMDGREVDCQAQAQAQGSSSSNRRPLPKGRLTLPEPHPRHACEPLTLYTLYTLYTALHSCASTPPRDASTPQRGSCRGCAEPPPWWTPSSCRKRRASTTSRSPTHAGMTPSWGSGACRCAAT